MSSIYEKMREIKEYLFTRYSEIEQLKRQTEREGDKVGSLINKNRAQIVAEIYNCIFNEDIA